MLTHEELERIPLRYRLFVKILLKIPIPNVPFWVLRHFPEFEGFFWALVVPISLAVFFWAELWFIPFLSFHFDFPWNVIIGSLIPAIPFVFFLRIQLERTILWWRNIHEKPREWQISKNVEELVELLNRQQKRNKP